MAILLPKRWGVKPPLGTPVNPAHPSSVGLVLDLLFNDFGGAVIHDAIARYGNGSLINGATWENGQYGADIAVSSASQQHVSVPYNSQYSFLPAAGGSGFSTEVIVWFNNLSKSHVFLSDYNVGSATQTFLEYCDSSGNLTVYYNILQNQLISGVFAANKWYHVVVSCSDSVASSGAINVWVNGANVFSASNSLPVGGAAMPILVGSHSFNPSGNNLDGKLALARVWNRALTTSEVAALNGNPWTIYGVASRKIRFFDPTAAQTIDPPTIVSGESWPTPQIIGGVNNINFATVPTGERWFTPVVAGPITPAIIPSGETWYAPTIRVSQTIHAGSASPFVEAIPSGETWYTPRVSNVQTILVNPIPSGETWFTPTIEGSAVFINVAPIPSAETWFLPTIIGGVQGVFLFLSGIDRTQYLSWVSNAVRIQSQTLGRWSATFDLYDGTGSFVPVLGQTVLFTDNGARVFAGCIQEIQVDRQLSTVTSITYHCTATDKSSICDHRVIVGKTYTALDTFGNPVTVQSVILDIVTNFLNGEGIGTAGVPSSLGNLDIDLNWNFPTVTQAFDQIAQNEGLVWWIDANCILYFSPFDTLPAAPISLTETSYNWRNLVLKTTTTAYYNKLYAVSNLNILPGSGSGGTGGGAGQTGNTETFTFTAGQPGIVVAPGGAVTGFNVSVSIASVISMTVNGGPQTVYDITQYTGQTRTGPTDFLWWYGPGNTMLSFTFGGIPVGATIVIDYVPASTNASGAQYGQALKPLNPSGQPLGTCGSGVYEGVLQVQNIADQATLNAVALAELDRIQGIPSIVDFQTDYPGLAPGQLLSVYIPLIGANNLTAALSLMVTSVSGTFIPPGPFPLTGGSFRWDVEANSNLDPGNWYKWFERLVGATANPLPVLQYEQATFILGPGTNLAGGNDLTNPYPVGRTGRLASILVVGATPPADQDLVIQITDNNVVIGSITLPSTAAANQSFTYIPPVGTPLYVYQGDNLNCNANYSVTGPSPIPASNVTVAVRWSS